MSKVFGTRLGSFITQFSVVISKQPISYHLMSSKVNKIETVILCLCVVIVWFFEATYFYYQIQDDKDCNLITRKISSGSELKI